MGIFDFMNSFLHSHPVMLDQLEFAFRIKFWLLLILAFYFILLPHREKIKKEKKLSLRKGQFLA